MKSIIPTKMTIDVTAKRFISEVYSINQLKNTVVNFDARTSAVCKMNGLVYSSIQEELIRTINDRDDVTVGVRG